MSGFWSAFIIVLVVAQIVGALWLLQAFTRRPTSEGSGAETTGHVWDGDLREYNNPLPRWWLMLFWLTAAFAVGYLVIFPGLGSFSGLLGWSQQEQYREQLAAAEERYGDIYAAFDGMSLQAMADDPDAVRLGRNLFLNNCATCHGSDGRGARGFPNLADDSWLYGDSSQAIMQTLTNGRVGVMPALGAALGEEGLDQVVAYVRQLGRLGDVDAQKAAAGEPKYAQFCASCHGAEGKGMQALGAPNLTDDAWLHGSDEQTIRDVILNGRVNRMPAQKDLLSEDRIRTLGAYVLSLSGER